LIWVWALSNAFIQNAQRRDQFSERMLGGTTFMLKTDVSPNPCLSGLGTSEANDGLRVAYRGPFHFQRSVARMRPPRVSAAAPARPKTESGMRRG